MPVHIARALALGCSILTSAFGLSSAIAAEKVVVATARTVSDAGLYMAMDLGYFAQEGLEVEMVAFDTAAKMIFPLGRGDLDVGGGTVSAGLYNAVSRGIELRIVADKGSIKPGYAYAGIVIRKDLIDSGRFKTLADLAGLKIAVVGRGTSNASALNEALKHGGLTWKDATPIELSFTQMVVGLRNKAIDGAMMNEPTISQVAAEGVGLKAADYNDFYPGQQTAVLIYSQKFATERRAAAQGFMRAYIKGLRFYHESLKDGRIAGPNAAQVIDILVKNTGNADRSIYEKLAPSAVDPDGRLSTGSLRNDLTLYKEERLIDDPKITVDDIVDGSFVEDALLKLGQINPKR
jgi:NitT/TauT family transport system substrate-binding protein